MLAPTDYQPSESLYVVVGLRGEVLQRKYTYPLGLSWPVFFFVVFFFSCEIFNTRVILFMKLSEFEGQGCYGN